MTTSALAQFIAPSLSRHAATACALMLAVVYPAYADDTIRPDPNLTPDAVFSVPQTGPATVCFTSGNDSAPGGDCAGLVVTEIGNANTTLLVQAYNFTEKRIINAIIDAHQRGVAVTVLLDKISPKQSGEGADTVASSGIPVLIDRRPHIAHNKVMVIDGTTVITGSFNFSENAQCCNAENLLVLHSPDLAAAYATNFARRQAVSVTYVPQDARAHHVAH